MWPGLISEGMDCVMDLTRIHVSLHKFARSSQPFPYHVLSQYEFKTQSSPQVLDIY
jgi:hypothetical protein